MGQKGSPWPAAKKDLDAAEVVVYTTKLCRLRMTTINLSDT